MKLVIHERHQVVDCLTVAAAPGPENSGNVRLTLIQVNSVIFVDKSGKLTIIRDFNQGVKKSGSS